MVTVDITYSVNGELEESVQEQIENYINENFNTSHEFLVCDDEGRDKVAYSEIRESLWAFNSSFIMSHIKQSVIDEMTDWEYTQLKKALENIQGTLCEGANGIILALIEDLESFIDDAVMSDGYGNYLNRYDGSEHELEIDGTMYYIYYS